MSVCTVPWISTCFLGLGTLRRDPFDPQTVARFPLASGLDHGESSAGLSGRRRSTSTRRTPPSSAVAGVDGVPARTVWATLMAARGRASDGQRLGVCGSEREVAGRIEVCADDRGGPTLRDFTAAGGPAF